MLGSVHVVGNPKNCSATWLGVLTTVAVLVLTRCLVI